MIMEREYAPAVTLHLDLRQFDRTPHAGTDANDNVYRDTGNGWQQHSPQATGVARLSVALLWVPAPATESCRRNGG
jgi:hypothetical protein